MKMYRMGKTSIFKFLTTRNITLILDNLSKLYLLIFWKQYVNLNLSCIYLSPNFPVR